MLRSVCEICLQNQFQGKCAGSYFSVTTSGGFFTLQTLEFSFIAASC